MAYLDNLYKATTPNMAAASDKARFYLEQQVPELQEYERKGIFTSEEITSIASKRSDFEHKLNARGSKPSDYARYATYEMNLDILRKKRCARLGVKGSRTFSGQRTVFFILDRATKKFPGDMGLWMQYIHFCQQQKANKKLATVFTKVLRLKPREHGIWILAAKHYAETQGDMGTARSYMQRGLRFCKDDFRMWHEYMRLEMGYLAKLTARRKILGLDEQPQTSQGDDAADADVIMLPPVTSEDIDPDASKGVEEVDANALKKLAQTPALTGGIPIAIFDAASKQFPNNPALSYELFDLIASYESVPATKKILAHIYSYIFVTAPESPENALCHARRDLFGIKGNSVDLPAALCGALPAVRHGPPASSPKVAEEMVRLLLPYYQDREDEMDESIIKVLDTELKRVLRVLAPRKDAKKEQQVRDGGMALLSKFEASGRGAEGELLRAYIGGLRTT